MTCRAQATLDLQTPRSFLHHDLDFSQPTPMGFAQCRRCGGFFTLEQYLEWRCEGAQSPSGHRMDPRSHGAARAEQVASPNAVPCALCGDPVLVDPMHRAVVEWFGVTCNSCFESEAAHV